MNNTPCGYSLHCFDKVDHEQRKKLFGGYWSSCDLDVQSAYLCGCVKTVEVKRRYTHTESSQRSHSRVYYVSKGGLSVRVCKKAFLRMHGISNGRLDRALRAQIKNGGSPHNDQRGRHPPANKTSEADMALIKEHIQSFPQYQSHYSRASNPHQKYLSPQLTISKMYVLYKEWCVGKEKTPQSEWVYRQVFNKSFNFSFGS